MKTNSEMNIDKLIEMMAEMNKVIMEQGERIYKLEQNISTEGVYLDGAPDYVKMYVSDNAEKR
jgi:hypothetical protein